MIYRVLGTRSTPRNLKILEEDVEPCRALDRPDNAAVLEPCVGEDAVQAAENVDEVLDADVLIVKLLVE
jgi:hypothetical protein